MGRSTGWVSQVERGIQPVERLSVLRELAGVFGVSVQDLRPDDLARASAETANSDELRPLRLSLSGHPALDQVLDPDTDRPASDFVQLTAAVDRAWELTHASRFVELTALLATLLPDLETGSRTAKSKSDRQRLHELRTKAYQAAAAAFARQDEPDAAWVAADRAIAAGEQAGDPLDVIAGHFRLAHAFSRLQRYDQAEHVIAQAIKALRPRADRRDVTPELLSLLGAMYLVQAVVAAQQGERASAHESIRAAAAIAERLGEDRNDYDTEFGPTNVQLHHVAIAIDLGDAGEALDAAQDVDPSGLSPERQTRFLIDVARAHSQRRQISEATAALLRADDIAPEQLRSHQLARDVLDDLLEQAGPRASAELRDLGQRVGLA